MIKVTVAATILRYLKEHEKECFHIYLIAHHTKLPLATVSRSIRYLKKKQAVYEVSTGRATWYAFAETDTRKYAIKFRSIQ